MKISVKDQETYAYTGGKAIRSDQPTVIFIHGVLEDHSVWALQSRFIANHGWNVLAVDLPGHCRSAGEAPDSVQAGADFIAALMDSLGLQQVALIGHSWGSLIALEAAAQLQARVSHLVLLGTASPMRVTPALIEAAQSNPMAAIKSINQFSHSLLAPPPSSLGPGTWVKGAALALNRRVFASNTKVNVFHRGFLACNNYHNGLQAIARITCAVLMISGKADQMTPASTAQSLYQAARDANKNVQICLLETGHALMSESPEDCLRLINDFLQGRVKFQV